jgi:hypothetical protein
MSQPDDPLRHFSDNVFAPGPFAAEPPAAPPPRRSSVGCWIVAILLSFGFLVLVCGGGGVWLFRIGLQVLSSQIEDELAGNPVLVEQIGDIESFEVDFARSVRHEDSDTFVYRVRGSKGNGRVVVKQATEADGTVRILSAELHMSSGEVFNLMP